MRRPPTGDRALAIARAAATNRLVAPPGWWIVAVARAALVALRLPRHRRAATAGTSPSPELVELLSTLLADQLQRSRSSGPVRASSCDGWVTTRMSGRGARREAARCGLVLADAYWPAMLGWRGRAPRPGGRRGDRREARADASGALSVLVAERTVLLHPRPTATRAAHGAGMVPEGRGTRRAPRPHRTAAGDRRRARAAPQGPERRRRRARRPLADGAACGGRPAARVRAPLRARPLARAHRRHRGRRATSCASRSAR